MKKNKIEEIKICNICKLRIDDTKEFVKVINFKNNNKIFSEEYYHIECLRDKFIGNCELQKLTKQANNLLSFAKSKLGYDEVVEL